MFRSTVALKSILKIMLQSSKLVHLEIHILKLTLPKIQIFPLISWCGKFVETHSLQRVFGNSSETLQKLCVSTKFPHQQIRSDYSTLCSVNLSTARVVVHAKLFRKQIWTVASEKRIVSRLNSAIEVLLTYLLRCYYRGN